MGKQEWGRRRVDNQPYPKTKDKDVLPRGLTPVSGTRRASRDFRQRPLNLQEAIWLLHGDVLEHTILKNPDGTPQRWTVFGVVRRWITRPRKIKVSIKRNGELAHITNADFRNYRPKKGYVLNKIKLARMLI